MRKSIIIMARVTEKTGFFIKNICDVCEKKNITMNGEGDVCTSNLITMMFEQITFADSTEKQQVLTSFLKRYPLTQKNGEPVTENILNNLVQEILSK